MAIPGLPALATGVVIEAVALIAQDVLSFMGALGEPQWGLFLDGEPAVVADNVLSFDFRQDMRISNYPVEKGSFQSYNKVQVPYDVRLQFSTGGSIADRQELIQSVDDVIISTDLFDAVTPEKVFTSLNPVHQGIRRTSRNGVGLLIVDLYCQQVRVTATQQFASSQQPGNGGTNTTMTIKSIGGTPINQPQSPSAAPQVSDGTVQPIAPTAAQSASFSDMRGTGFDF